MSENNDSFMEAVESMQRAFQELEDRSKYIVEIEYQFYNADNNVEALRLAKEALGRGMSHPLFDYICGFCYYHGHGVSENKAVAEKYFRTCAEARNANGDYYDDKHSNQARMFLIDDMFCGAPEFKRTNIDIAIAYCEVARKSDRWKKSALTNLILIYGDDRLGHRDYDKALMYVEQLLELPDVDRQKVQSMQQYLKKQQRKSKPFWGIFG